MTKSGIIAVDPAVGLEAWDDIPEAEIMSGTRKQNGCFLFQDKPRGLSVGLWEQEANETHWLDYPFNEFMIVLEGEVVIVEDDQSTTIKTGESFIIPKGLRCRWTQAGYVKKVFVIFDDASGVKNEGPLRTIKIDRQVKLEPSTPPSADMLLTPVPQQNAHEYFTDATGQLNIGIWDTTAYTRKQINFPRHELMHLIEGSVTMDDGAGDVRTFKAGDTLFVPLGTPNAWRCEGYLRKIYVIFQPKA